MTYNPNFIGIPPLAKSSAKTTQNNTGVTIGQAIPIKLTDTGMGLIDVSLESDVDAIAGITKSSVEDSGQTEIVTGGTIENISTTFNVGDPVYVSKTGGLTNQKPSIGTAGFTANDFIIRVGVIAKNNDNPLLKDLVVSIQIMGQL